MLLDVRLDHFETNTLFAYYAYQNATTTASRVKLTSDRGNFIQLTYSNNYTVINPSSAAFNNPTKDLTLSAGIKHPYFDFSGSISYSLVTQPGDNTSYITSNISYSTPNNTSYALALSIRPPGNCWSLDTRMIWVNTIPGTPPSTGINFSFMFDGKHTTKTTSI